MISKRLKALADYVEKEDKVADVGCDHGHLSIYLKRNNLCQSIIASDVNENALSNAIKNIKISKLDIKTYISDGILSLDMSEVDTLIIAGMGTKTIIKILSEGNISNVEKLILQSNNNHYELRKSINKLGYYLEQEQVVYENKKYYPIMKFVKSTRKNDKFTLKFGLSNDKVYFKHLIIKKEEILKRIPSYRIIQRIKLILDTKKLKKALT